MTDTDRFVMGMASRLLEYPDEELFGELPGLRDEILSRQEGDESGALKLLANFLDHLEKTGLRQSQEDYVAAFDMDPAASLYMAWHRYGNDRGQGKAMAALNGLYRAAGFEPEMKAMPDYLPVMLEFMAIGQEWSAKILLEGFGSEIAALVKNLLDAGNIYGHVLEAAFAGPRGKWPELFAPRTTPDPTLRPMARPEKETAPMRVILPLSHERAAMGTRHENSGCCRDINTNQPLPPRGEE